MNCRHCGKKIDEVFCDLQTCPPSNSMVNEDELNSPEVYFPLKVFVCTNCWLVQVDEMEKAEAIFSDNYTYFSSFSSSWLKHAECYTNYMIERFEFNHNSKVIEIASNDGYLLQYFTNKGIPVLGIEPTSNTAEVAKKKGINTIVDFFSSRLAKNEIAKSADLILGNNVLAHVPDINDFVRGVKIALKPTGVITFEFPHLCKLIEYNQFDTIYHEHFSYFSFASVKRIFEFVDLEIFDVQEIITHGGSLRVFAKHKEDSSKLVEDSVDILLNKEKQLGVFSIEYYKNFQLNVNRIKYSFIEFLLLQKQRSKKVIGYGAAAKGNTLLNYCGVKGDDLIDFVVDKSHYKQQKYLPGSRILVKSEKYIFDYKPDFIIIFPWNLKEEVIEQLSYVKEWGCKFVIAIPELQIYE
jgi:2-polyprenyl-3-methyl-5-hydroxy-6-metoxy-1,4-benzoquinol methylase